MTYRSLTFRDLLRMREGANERLVSEHEVLGAVQCFIDLLLGQRRETEWVRRFPTDSLMCKPDLQEIMDNQRPVENGGKTRKRTNF
jgi:hypothetical protein